MLVLAAAAVACARLGRPAGLASVLGVLVAAGPFLLLREYFRQLSVAHLRLGAVLALDTAVAGLQLGALLLLAYFRLLDIRFVFVTLAVACALACALWFATCRPVLRIVAAAVKADWRYNWSFGKWTLASFLVGSTTPLFVPWVLAGTHGEAATGLMAACVSVINLAGMYVAGITSVLTPRAVRAFADGGLPELREVLRRTVGLFLVSLGGFCLLILLTGDLAARLLYGNRYEGTAAVLALLAVTMLINSLGITAGNGLWALNRPAANFAADVCTLAVTLTVVSLLVLPLGVLGAALALLAGAAAGALVRWLTLLRCARAVQPAEGPSA
jgi:O-antigen/teichoic acid export membrane protein